MRNGDRDLAGNRGGRTVRKPRNRWEDNIEIERKEDERAWTGLIWLKVGTRSCSYGTIKCRDFCDQLRNCQIPKEELAVCSCAVN
jgi:hypothetical protein